MSQSSREEQIFETPNVDYSSAEHKLASYKDAMVERPTNKDRDDAISEVKRNPEAAFGVFNGKVFNAPKADYFSLADSIERRAESPLQRYARLRGELDELKVDLESMVEADTGKNSTSSVWSALQHEVNDLSASAASLESHKAFGLIRSNVANHEQSLLSLVDNLKHLHVVGNESGDTKDDAAAGLDSNALITLERRVHYLETILGSAGNINDINAASSAGKSACPFPLLDTVARLEERVTLLDVSELESIRAKCESVRNELDATLKSKSTIATESKVVDAAKQLSGLIGVADRVDAVAADLPNLVLRLKTLERPQTVHCVARSAVFGVLFLCKNGYIWITRSLPESWKQESEDMRDDITPLAETLQRLRVKHCETPLTVEERLKVVRVRNAINVLLVTSPLLIFCERMRKTTNMRFSCKHTPLFHLCIRVRRHNLHEQTTFLRNKIKACRML